MVASPRRLEVESCQPVELDEGVLLFPRRDEVTHRVMHHIYREGLFDAIRGRALVMLGYGARETGGEQGDLRVLTRSIAELLGLMATYGKLEETERQEVTDRFRVLAAHFTRVRNLAKREAREKLVAGASVRDRLGRPNPGASAARAVGAQNRLMLRAEEIREIAPWVGYYELALIAERDRLYGIFEDLGALLRNLVGPKGILYGEPRTYLRSRQGIMVQLGHAVSQLRTITVEPFIWSRDILAAELAEASRIFGSVGNTPSVRRLLDRSRRALGLRFIQREIEEVRLQLSCGIESGRLTPDEASDLGNTVLARRRVVESVDDSDFRARPRLRLSHVLAAAAEKLFLGKHREAKAHLAEAARLFSRP